MQRSCVCLPAKRKMRRTHRNAGQRATALKRVIPKTRNNELGIVWATVQRRTQAEARRSPNQAMDWESGDCSSREGKIR